MPVTVLHLDLGGSLRGGQRQVFYLVRHLARSGRYAPLTAAPRRAPLLAELQAARLDVLPLPGRREWDPRLWLLLEGVIRRRAVRILHTHDARAAALGALLKTRFGDRLALVHTRRVSYPLRSGFSRWKYRAADLTVGVSREITDALAASGLPRDRLAVVHSGLDPARYACRPRPAKPADAPLVIGLIGALTPQKGVATLLRALSLLPADLPAWRAVIVGDGPLAAELRHLADSLSLSPRVQFAGYQDSRHVLPDLDVLAVPSMDGEGSSGVIKEAWISGAALIASDLPSNLELVTPEADGLAFARSDPAALAEGVARLLRDPALRARLAAQGARSVLVYTDQAMAEAYVRLYRERLGL